MTYGLQVTPTYGLKVAPSEYHPVRDVITVAGATPNGKNVAVRLGEELPGSGGWTQKGYAILTAAEAKALAADLIAAAGDRPLSTVEVAADWGRD